MEPSLHERDGVTVIALHGAIDVGRALELREVVAGPVAERGRKLLLDLSDVTLVDSSGVGLFVTAHRRAEESGASFALAGLAGPVGRVFALTRTDKLLRIYDTVDEGLAALRDA